MSTDVRARVRKGVSVESFVVCQDCGCQVGLPRELDDLADVPLSRVCRAILGRVAPRGAGAGGPAALVVNAVYGVFCVLRASYSVPAVLA